MSATVVPIEYDILANPTPTVPVLLANSARAFLQIQNKDTGDITYKFGQNFLVPASAVQQITFQQIPTAGTWTVSVTNPLNNVTSTATFNYNDNAATIQTGLQALASVGANNVAVAGDYTATGFTLTFEGSLANINIAKVVVNTTGLSNNLVQTNAVQLIAFSEPPTSGNWAVSFGANTTTSLAWNISAADLMTALNALPSISGGVSAVAQDGTSKNFTVTFGSSPLADQAVALLVIAANTLNGSVNQASAVYVIADAVEPISGTFNLSDGVYTTTALQWNCAASDVQAALQALPSIGAGNVTVTGINLVGGFTITYGGALANVAVPNLLFINPVANSMRATNLLSDTLEAEDDVTLDDQDPNQDKLAVTVTTIGRGLDAITTVVNTTVPGAVPGPVTAVVATTTGGQAVTNDGTLIPSGASPVLFATECPTDSLWIRSANTSAAVTVLEG